MEQIVKQTLLYDFYGELLTERQRQVYESVILDDYSVSEVAQDLGISRQSIHDMVKRCNQTLEEYEEKLQLVDRFIKIRQQVLRIHSLAEEQHLEEIRVLSGRVLEEL